MSGLLGILIFIVALLFSIALHEIGHMLPAKKFGAKVSQYMIGFGPTIWSRQRGETEYGLKLIPLGGFVRILGMFPPRPDGPMSDEELELLRESKTFRARMTLLIESTRSDSLAELGEDQQNRAFYRLSVPKKVIVMFGGPFMNLVIATILFGIATVGIGSPQVNTAISDIVACVPTADNAEGIESVDGGCGNGKHTPAHLLGLQKGDQLTAIDGIQIQQWEDISAALKNKAGKVVTVNWIRGEDAQSGSATIASWTRPVLDEQGKKTDATETVSFLGVQPMFEYVSQPISALPGFVWQQAVDVAKAIIGFPAGVIGVGDSLVTDQPRDSEGFVSIIGVGQVSSNVAANSEVSFTDKLLAFLYMFASLNMFLFVFNLVPILPLDGGHIAGAIFEGFRKTWARIRRKPLPPPVDTAKMMPVAYIAAIFLISASLVLMLADIFKPISF